MHRGSSPLRRSVASTSTQWGCNAHKLDLKSKAHKGALRKNRSQPWDRDWVQQETNHLKKHRNTFIKMFSDISKMISNTHIMRNANVRPSLACGWRSHNKQNPKCSHRQWCRSFTEPLLLGTVILSSPHVVLNDLVYCEYESRNPLLHSN